MRERERKRARVKSTRRRRGRVQCAQQTDRKPIALVRYCARVVALIEWSSRDSTRLSLSLIWDRIFFCHPRGANSVVFHLRAIFSHANGRERALFRLDYIVCVLTFSRPSHTFFFFRKKENVPGIVEHALVISFCLLLRYVYS